ncbi:hypothetical protein Pmani_016332 [Petrolisthes manimaculis]|uniref:Uncharacterized protein n=1 Tax=Petrolisthes manimaculis TaxID=1843537 RepID=A0AAE1PRV2_9EUCA|nr:hypothetical protein Pmani_016332 [Petrolisthes manimaculis]
MEGYEGKWGGKKAMRGLEDGQEREVAISLGLPESLQEEGVLKNNPLLAFLLNIFNSTPQQTRHALSQEWEAGMGGARSPKRLYFAPRLGKRSRDTTHDQGEVRREKRQVMTDNMNHEAADEDTYGSYSWWWPLVRRSPFVPRPGKRGGEEDASDLMDAEEQLNDNLAKYLDQQQQQQQQQEAAPATDMKRGNGFAFTPRLGKKSFAFVPRPGKKGDFAFTPRLGKKADFAFVPRPGRRGDFAFTPRLGKKADFAFTPRLGKKADFAFTPRLGKREVAVVEEEEA